MKLVYVAGRFRGATPWDVRQNVNAAERAAFDVAQLGLVPIAPHVLYQNYDKQLTDEFWLDGTLEIMRRCDAVYIFNPDHVNGLKPSVGTVGEVREAFRLGIPVFTSLESLKEWSAPKPVDVVPECLRPLSDEEVKEFVPISDSELSKAFDEGARAVGRAKRIAAKVAHYCACPSLVCPAHSDEP